MKNIYFLLTIFTAISFSTRAQNVGIGEAAPSTKLEIKGDGSDLLNVKDNSNDSKLFIDSDGNVGIGTSSPSYKLDVKGAIAYNLSGFDQYSVSVSSSVYEELTFGGNSLPENKVYRVTLSTTGTGTNTGYVGVVWYNSDATAWNVRHVSRSGTSSNHPYLFIDANTVKVRTDHSSNYNISVSIAALTSDDDDDANIFGADYMWQRVGSELNFPDGNVGIGVTNPSFKLDVSGTARFTGQVSIPLTPSSNEHAASKKYVDDQIGSSVSGADDWDISGSDIYNNNSGNVGVGTSTPSEKLDVNGNIEINDVLIDANQDWSIGGSSENFQIREPEESNKLWAEFIDDGGLHLSGAPDLYADGNIGIGTTTPSVPLEINKEITGAGTLFKLSKYEADISASSEIYMDFEFTDGNANGTPQARIGAQANTDLSLGSGTEAEGTADMIFYTASAAGASTNDLAERMRIKATGDLQFSNYSNGYLQVDGSGNMSTISTIPSGSITEADPSWSGTTNTTGSIGRTGNVGIGKTSPSTVLDIEGNVAYPINITRTGNVGDVGIEFHDTDVNSQTGYFTFEHGNTESEGNGASFHFNSTETTMGIILDVEGGYYASNEVALISNGDSYLNGGNLGLGTTSPGAKIHAYNGGVGANTGTTDMLRLEINRNDHSTTPSGPAILFKDQDTNNGTNEARIKMFTVNDTDFGDNDEAASNLIFETTNAGTASDKMIITGRGDIGIGTNNPQAQLHTTGDIRFANYSNGYLQVDANGDVSTISTIPSGSINEDDPTWSGSANTTASVGRTGNVGIGTISPADKLDVSGNIAITGGMRSRGPNYTSTWMVFDEHQYGNSTIIGAGGLTAIGAGESVGQVRANVAASAEDLYMSADGSMQFFTGMQSGWASRVNAMAISAAGDVAIGGGTSSSYKLRVYGRVRSNGINETSDARLKKNVKSLENALDKVMALRGVNYEWRKEEYPEFKLSEGVELGLLAQEVEEVLPQIVDTDSEGFKSVQYSHIVPVLIEAIKEQQLLIQDKESEIQTMQSQLDNKDCEIQDLRKDFGQMKAEMSEIKELLQMSAQK